MCRLLALVFAFLVLPVTSFPLVYAGQNARMIPGEPGTLRGRVLDATGAPVPGARIVVTQAEQRTPVLTAATDPRGEFALTLPSGAYGITITATGFRDGAQRVVIGPAPTRLEVVLNVAGISERVDVGAFEARRATVIDSATKTSMALRDVPQAVSVVTRELMADQRMASMADVVRFMPGVAMAQGEGNRDTPILRGNSSTSDFFVDGVRDDVQYLRDVYNVDRVEALKGPNAMIFGRGGAGGVINRITRQADWTPSTEITLQAGSWNNRRLTADTGTALGDAAVRLTGMYENSDTYRSGVGLKRYGVQPSAAFRLGPATMLRASYEHFHDERTADRGIPSFDGRPVETAAATFFGDPALSRVDATVNLFASVLEHAFDGRTTLRNRVSYGVYDKFYQNVFPGAVNAAGTSVSISGYNNATDRRNVFNQTDLTLRLRAGAIQHTLLVGAELGRQVTDNFRSTGYFTSAGSTTTSVSVPVAAPTIALPVTFRQSASDADNHGVANIVGVYAQDHIHLTSKLQALAGIRFDAFDLNFTNNRTGAELSSRDRVVSPRAGLIFKPVMPLSLYGSYSVTFVPRGGDQLSSLSLSNQALEPEEFRNYEMGAKWDITPSLGATAAVYRLDRGNVAIPDPADPTRALLVDAQRTKGLELELNGAVTPLWTVTAGYAFQKGSITRSISSGAPAGAELAQVPEHSVSLWSKYQVAPRWSAAVGLIRRSAMFAATDNRVVLPAFTRVDGAVFFDVTPALRAQVNVENLFDEAYFASAHNNNNIMPGSPRALRFSLVTRF